MRLEFTKMEGCGNDYIYIDAASFDVADPSALSVRLSDRHFGIGADGLVLIGRCPEADFSMRMFNADGSEGAMCGNAARCIGKYVFDRGLTDRRSLTLATKSGIKQLTLHTGADGLVDSVTVGMGGFRIEAEDFSVEAGGSLLRGVLVDVGNPHFVVFCPDADAVDLRRVGPLAERHFEGGRNVEFASVRPDGSIRMRVWERGSGITLACGTGACATAAAAVTLGLAGSPCLLRMDGGELEVAFKDGRLLLKGPARTVFDGTI